MRMFVIFRHTYICTGMIFKNIPGETCFLSESVRVLPTHTSPKTLLAHSLLEGSRTPRVGDGDSGTKAKQQLSDALSTIPRSICLSSSHFKLDEPIRQVPEQPLVQVTARRLHVCMCSGL